METILQFCDDCEGDLTLTATSGSGESFMQYRIAQPIEDESGTIKSSLDASGYMSAAEIAINGTKLNFDGCRDGQMVIYREVTIQCEDIPQRRQEMNYLTFSGILTIVVITIIVSKWIVPKINCKTAIRWFFHMIYKPGKAEVDNIYKEWEAVKKE